MFILNVCGVRGRAHIQRSEDDFVQLVLCSHLYMGRLNGAQLLKLQFP